MITSAFDCSHAGDQLLTQRSGRISCSKCGANNFEAVSACWKCGAPLNSNASAMSPSTPSYAPSASGGQYGYTPERIPSQNPVSYPQPTGDPNVANRAAVWLALTIPFIGLPVGWVFMMVEDQRKQRVGRICVMWSLFALVFHLIFTVVLLKSATSGLMSALGPAISKMAGGQQGGGGTGLPGE